MVYVVLGSNVSMKFTFTRLPEDVTRGTAVPAGETVTLLKASLTVTSSSKSIVILSGLTLTDPSGGFILTTRGGASSTGPPEGVPIEAHE